MPDIDIDFCIERRQEVIEYVAEKYGRDHVAQLITFGTLGAKQVVRDVAPGHGYQRTGGRSRRQDDSVRRRIWRVQQALEESPRLREEYETDEKIHEWLDMAMKIEGMPRQSSTHAAAVVISASPVTWPAGPSTEKDESITTQYNMHNIEALGLLKMDFLGLRTLTVIRDAVALIRKNRGIEVDMDDLDFTDPAVYALISSGETDGIFQLESDQGAALAHEPPASGKPGRHHGRHLAVPPRPMAKIPDYIEYKHHPEKVKYDHPLLEKILKDTYGCMVYQEQVMEIVRDMAGYSLARSDEVRRAMAKEKKDVMERERQIFVYGGDGIEGAVHRGVPKATAQRVLIR